MLRLITAVTALLFLQMQCHASAKDNGSENVLPQLESQADCASLLLKHIQEQIKRDDFLSLSYLNTELHARAEATVLFRIPLIELTANLSQLTNSSYKDLKIDANHFTIANDAFYFIAQGPRTGIKRLAADLQARQNSQAPEAKIKYQILDSKVEAVAYAMGSGGQAVRIDTSEENPTRVFSEAIAEAEKFKTGVMVFDTYLWRTFYMVPAEAIVGRPLYHQVANRLGLEPIFAGDHDLLFPWLNRNYELFENRAVLIAYRGMYISTGPGADALLSLTEASRESAQRSTVLVSPDLQNALRARYELNRQQSSPAQSSGEIYGPQRSVTRDIVAAIPTTEAIPEAKPEVKTVAGGTRRLTLFERVFGRRAEKPAPAPTAAPIEQAVSLPPAVKETKPVPVKSPAQTTKPVATANEIRVTPSTPEPASAPIAKSVVAKAPAPAFKPMPASPYVPITKSSEVTEVNLAPEASPVLNPPVVKAPLLIPSVPVIAPAPAPKPVAKEKSPSAPKDSPAIAPAQRKATAAPIGAASVAGELNAVISNELRQKLATLEMKYLTLEHATDSSLLAKALARPQGKLEHKVIQSYRLLLQKDLANYEQNLDLLSDPKSEKELLALVREEQAELLNRIESARTAITQVIASTNVEADKVALIEIAPDSGQFYGNNVTILRDMYLGLAKKMNWSVEITDTTNGDKGMLKFVSLRIEGPGAYALLQSERGTHRFMTNDEQIGAERFTKEMTNYIEVRVYRETENLVSEIKDSDLSIETMRASGPGGQNVNKRDTAVRVRHTPSGISVRAETHRSQSQNKRTAIAVIAERLREKEESNNEARFQAERNQTQASESPYVRFYDRRKVTQQLQETFKGNIADELRAKQSNAILQSILDWPS